ncbi:MAG: PAS domain-containing protein, partial [Gammaproteobacteria bacterium]|nr:PAS domain-containing protein [Gammaproteobacteria bacterium]
MTPRFSQSPFNTYSDHSPLIYLVDNHADQTELLKQVLLDSGYRVQVFAEADMLFHTACTDSTTESPAAVVMDIIFSGDDIAASSVKGFDVCKNAGIPFLSVSVRDDLSARLAAFRMGAKHYLSKPINSDRLIEILDELTGRQQAVPYRILLVDDDQELLDFNQALFGGAGMVVRTLSEPLKTLDVVKDFAPDVVVLDVYMPDITGPELAAILRDSGFQLPILFLSVEDDIDQQIQALSQGGDDFLTKSVQADHLLATVTARAQRSRRSNAVCYRLEKNLYEREREHLALNQHAIVTIADGNGNITYANELFCQVSGYSFGELVGQNHRIVRSGLHSDEFYKEMWQTISNGNVWHGELCNRSKTGSLHWMESTITPFLDDDGKPYQYISIRTDITRNKEREHALRAIVDGTMAVSGESFIRNTVQGLADSMGLRWSFIARIDDDDESMFRTVAMWDTDQIIDNFSYPVVGTPCERVLQNGLSVYAENVAELFPEDAWLRENGIESYIGIPLFDSNGNFLGHMGVMDEKPIINVDEKINFLRIFAASVANELEREQSEKYLQASEARLNFLVNSSPVTIYTSTATPPYAATYISPNIKQLLGYEPEQFTENPNFWADNIHPDDQQQVFDNLPQLFEHGKHQHEYRFRKPDGSYVWMHDELRLIRNAAGEPIEITGYWADISNRKLTEQLLELNKERLRRGQVFANIGTWDWNIVTGELFWSERIGPLFGYQDGELETSYENFLGAVHEDDRQSVIDAVNDCVEHGIPYDIEHRVTWPDGTVRWLHERGAVVRDADGKPL